MNRETPTIPEKNTNNKTNHLQTEISKTIATNPIIEETLGNIYRTESIYTKNIESIDNDTFRISCVFPEYELTIDVPDHISIVQMQTGIIQSIFVAIAEAGKQNKNFPSFSKQQMIDAIYRRDTRTFHKMIQPNEEAHLKIHIENITQK